jgi:acid phosphatase (class A)
LQGYLAKEEIPNSLALVPPPPEEGSAAFALDQEYAKKAVESKDSARFNLAVTDAELHFPAAVKSFESTLGMRSAKQKHQSCMCLCEGY